jgi:hypothetical protein
MSAIGYDLGNFGVLWSSWPWPSLDCVRIQLICFTDGVWFRPEEFTGASDFFYYNRKFSKDRK